MDQKRQAEICARIKQARVEAGLTLEDAADALGVVPRAYWNYENNRVPFKRLDDIARITGSQVEWLLRGDTASPLPTALEPELLKGVAAAVSTLEDSQRSVHRKIDEALARLARIEDAVSNGRAARATPRKSHPAS